MLEGPYDRKSVFTDVHFFNLQAGQIIIQAHKTPLSILLSVSIKISDQLFEGIDKELYPPGLSYVKTTLSSANPDSVLWGIIDQEEGVLTFPPCPLPESAFCPEIINFTFPLEALYFTPPSRENSVQRLLKFSHQRGILSFQNLSGDPPILNPPPSMNPESDTIIKVNSFRNKAGGTDRSITPRLTIPHITILSINQKTPRLLIHLNFLLSLFPI
jgi:hypothetical protein